jgi:hypothetical protein
LQIVYFCHVVNEILVAIPDQKVVAMPIYEIEGIRPQIADSAYVHPTAEVIGQVRGDCGAPRFLSSKISLCGENASLI